MAKNEERKEQIKQAIDGSGLVKEKEKYGNKSGKKSGSKVGKFFAIFAAAVIIVVAAAFLTACGNTQTTAQQLATTTITYNMDSKIVSWTEVPNASKYEVKVESKKLGVSKESNLGKDVKSISLKDYLTQSTDDCVVSVTAIGDGSSYTNSETAQQTINYVQEQQSEATKLVMGAIRFDETTKTFSWDKVENATGYRVKVNGSEAVQEASQTSYKLSENATGQYQIEVVALGNGTDFTDSTAATKTIDLQQTAQLSAVENIEVSNSAAKTISWKAVENATGYKVTYAGQDYAVQTGTSFTVPSSVTLSESDTISVVAVGNDFYTNSEVASKSGFITRVATPENLKFQDNTFTWDAVNGATKYVVTVNGVAQTEQTERAYAITSGTANVSVVAKGNGGFVLDSQSTQQVQGTYAEQQPTSYADVEAALTAKLQTETQALYPRGPVSNLEVLGIDTATGTVYYNYNIGTAYRTATAKIDGLKNVASYDDALAAVNAVTLKYSDLLGTNCQNNDNAKNLVIESMTREFTGFPTGYTAEDIQFAIATTFNIEISTEITVVFDNLADTKPAEIVTYTLQVVASSSSAAYGEFVNDAYATASNVQTSSYSELEVYLKAQMSSNKE